MTGRFDNIDLSQLPFPAVVENLSFPDLKAAYIAALKSELADAGFDWDMDLVEADPGSALAEATGYREMLVRGRVNDAAKAVMLAFATGSDLDNLAAFYSVVRLDAESDDAFRARVQLAPEALSVAGPRGAYAFHTLKVSPQIIDVAVYSLKPGTVHVVPLVASGNGQPSDDLIAAVGAVLSDEDVRPLTDNLAVRKPRPLAMPIAATLIVALGPDLGQVRTAALASLNAYLAARRRIGRTVYRSGIIAALQTGGVYDVILAAPAADVVADKDEVINVAAITLTAIRGTEQ